MVVKNGNVGGLIAGAVFLAFEMLYALIAAGNLFGPLAMMTIIPMQMPPPEIGLGSAIVVGLITHAILSGAFGVVATYIVNSVEQLRRSTASLLVAYQPLRPRPVAAQLLRALAGPRHAVVRHGDERPLAGLHRPHVLLRDRARRLPRESAPPRGVDDHGPATELNIRLLLGLAVRLSVRATSHQAEACRSRLRSLRSISNVRRASAASYLSRSSASSSAPTMR